MKPSARLEDMCEYFFVQKQREIRALEAKGHSVINLGIGSPDLEPHEGVIDALCIAAREEGSYRYQPYRGIPELRQALFDWYHSTYKLEKKNSLDIIPLMGSKEGVGHISLTFLEKGDKVLVPDPGYPAYTNAARIAGAEALTYKLSEKNNWYPDMEELESLLDERVKLIWLNYPAMPSGQKASREVFQRLVELARRHRVLLCNDNPYSLTLNHEPVSLLSIPGAEEVALELNSLSKSHNLAGLRMGMLAGAEQLVGYVFRVYSQFSSGMFHPAQKAAIQALSLDRGWYEQLNEEYRERKAIAHRILTKLGCTFSPDSVGLFVWGRVPEYAGDGDILSERLLYEAGTFLTPGSVFGQNGKQYIRISLCAPASQMQAALSKINSLNTTLQTLNQ
jgi:LL-diaminopimelate aminotransferase